MVVEVVIAGWGAGVMMMMGNRCVERSRLTTVDVRAVHVSPPGLQSRRFWGRVSTQQIQTGEVERSVEARTGEP